MIFFELRWELALECLRLSLPKVAAFEKNLTADDFRTLRQQPHDGEHHGEFRGDTFLLRLHRERPFPGSTVELERAVGMQTDIQRTYVRARHTMAFWVGGSALMRRAALEDVCESSSERGYLIRKFIQDRTLVEDCVERPRACLDDVR